MLTRRPDGRLAREVPAYRRLIPYLMRRKGESVVFFEQVLDVGVALDWLHAVGRARPRTPSIFSLVLASLARTIREWPRLNRFVSGRRIHERSGVYLSFAAKTAMDEDAPLRLIKREFSGDESFGEILDALDREVAQARTSRAVRGLDREVDVLARLPGVLLGGGIRLLWVLDRLGLAPRPLLASDPMYTSAFLANLGSLGLDAAYHHLYEHGNCPLFVTVGAVRERALVNAGGQVVARPSLVLKYSYDERIEDGLYCARALERLAELITDPAATFGSP